MKDLILKLNHPNSLQKSTEGLKINKFISSISSFNFIKLLNQADNKVNPRIASINKITKSIHETLDKSPELFWYKSKGLLLATESCELLDRNRIKLSFNNLDYEGIMDGGHNTFAIAIFIIEKLFDKKLKKWDECKEFWDKNYDELIKRFKERESEFNFSIPIEVITPNDEDGSLEQFYDFISEICSARNNNVQLKETAKGNQVGYYDYLKEILDNDFDIIWKTGDSGKIKSEDVISLASLGLIFLKNNGKLPKDLKSLNKISIYSQKSKCVDFFNNVLSHNQISTEEKGKFILQDPAVKSALSLTKDILSFFDRMYVDFPSLYHKATPGKFGRITAVNNKKKGRVPFYTTTDMADYQYSFGFFYPIVAGLTNLMGYDERNNEVFWRVNPKNLDLQTLELNQYVNIIKLVNFDPQKIGKGDVFYKEAETVFERVIN